MAKILVVDDSLELLELFSTLLIAQGYEVETTSSSVNLKNILLIFLPDLILMDVMFGIEDGRELCREIKETHNINIPIILISANVALLKDYKRCKADAVIEKPFNIKNLVEVVSRVLNEYETADD